MLRYEASVRVQTTLQILRYAQNDTLFKSSEPIWNGVQGWLIGLNSVFKNHSFT